MSDLDHLDRAFEALTRQLAHEHGPGAASAISTARKRRRTRVGAVALTALVVVGGGLAVPRLVFPEDGVAARGGGARLDASALATATAGWTSGWEMWELSSPVGGRDFGAASCHSPAPSDGETPPEPASRGTSKFLGPRGASGVFVLEQYADASTATASQHLSLPPPDTCGATTTYDVDGVRVRHDSMPPEAPGVWLGDIWSVQVGADRAQLELMTAAGVADGAAAERVAEALVAGLRDGWTQSGKEEVGPALPQTPQLPAFDGGALGRALGGWQAASRGSASTIPNTPCLGEQVDTGSITASSGGTPRGVTWAAGGFADKTTGDENVLAMINQLRACRDPEMTLHSLANGVTLVTYDSGGTDGRGALWLSAVGDRAAVIGMDGADRPMPAGVAEDVARVLDLYLREPWE